jgi:hypothetical protein
MVLEYGVGVSGQLELEILEVLFWVRELERGVRTRAFGRFLLVLHREIRCRD